LSGINSAEQALNAKIEAFRNDYERDQNPVHVWRALFLVMNFSLEKAVPNWIAEYLRSSTDAVIKIYQKVKEGEKIEREAENIGKALGFGPSGKGSTSHFEDAFILDRDKDLYARVQNKLAAGDKLYLAYEMVAKDTAWSPSVIRRAYERIKPTESAAHK
jgi:hypothetical protein